MNAFGEEYQRNWRAIYAHTVERTGNLEVEANAADCVRMLADDIWFFQGFHFLGVGHSVMSLRQAAKALNDLADARTVAKAEREG